MNFQTPAEVAAMACNAGKVKSEMPIGKMIILSILAGAYIAFGANLATRVASPWMSGAVPQAGIDIFLFGAVFSVGLMMVVIGGAELFTGNNMFCFASVLNGQATWGGLTYNWIVVFFANFVGSLLLVYLVFQGNYWGSTEALSAQGIAAVKIASGKLGLDWYTAFIRGILCNWLVCMAVWLALAAKDVVGKVFAIFFPIMAFVASGFEHSIANMFFIPMGIAIAGAASGQAATITGLSVEQVGAFFSYGNFIMANLIPVTLGNIVGGALFVGLFYWYTYLKK